MYTLESAEIISGLTDDQLSVMITSEDGVIYCGIVEKCDVCNKEDSK